MTSERGLGMTSWRNLGEMTSERGMGGLTSEWGGGFFNREGSGTGTGGSFKVESGGRPGGIC